MLPLPSAFPHPPLPQTTAIEKAKALADKQEGEKKEREKEKAATKRAIAESKAARAAAEKQVVG